MPPVVVSTCLGSAGLKPRCRSIGIGSMRPRRLHGFTWLVVSAWACHLLALLPAPWAAPRRWHGCRRCGLERWPVCRHSCWEEGAGQDKAPCGCNSFGEVADQSLGCISRVETIYMSTPKVQTDKHLAGTPSFPPNLPSPTIFVAPQGLDSRDVAFMERLRNLAREALTWEHLSHQQRLVWAAARVGCGAGAADESRGQRVFLSRR